MTDDRLPLAELMAKTGDGDFLRSVAESVLQIIMEADVDGLIGAGRHERSGDRSTWRNGYRDRSLDTRLGTLNLKIPKLRTGAYFPGFLEPRKTVEKALVSVIQEAWIAGVSTRRVDDLVQAMGMSGISKSSVSKLCKDIDERVAGREPPTTPDNLRHHRCIRQRLPSGKAYRWEFEKRGQEVAIDAPGPLTLDNTGLMIEAAVDSLGIAYVPEPAARPWIENGRLVILLDDWCPLVPGLCLYYPGHRHVPAGLRALIDLLKADGTI